MSQGMADLYKRKYGLHSEPLEHSFPEAQLKEAPQAKIINSGFWGGMVYNINTQSLLRVHRAMKAFSGLYLTIASFQSTEILAIKGFDLDYAKRVYYTQRTEYIKAVQRQAFHILALDWPDESPIHRDELATIFPTKTIEYLASGRPIIAHCPEDYFMAKFIRDHGCGIIVSERSKDALVKAIDSVLTDKEREAELVNAAREALSVFSIDRITRKFRQGIESVATSHQ